MRANWLTFAVTPVVAMDEVPNLLGNRHGLRNPASASLTSHLMNRAPPFGLVLPVVGLVAGAAAAFAPWVLAYTIVPALGLVVVRSVARGVSNDMAVDARRRLVIWSLLAFCLRLFVGSIITNVRSLITYFGPDAFTYHEWSAALASHWDAGTPMPDLPAGKEAFAYVLGGLYWVAGPVQFAGLAFNATLGALLVPVLTDTTRRIAGVTAAHPVAPLVALLPGLVVWSSQLLREASVLLLIALAVNAAVRLTGRFGLARAMSLAAVLGALLSFRASTAALLGATMLPVLVLGRRSAIAGLGASLGVASLVALVVVTLGVGIAGFRLIAGTELSQVNAIRLDSSISASSGFSSDADVSTPQRALTYLPTGLPAFMLGPPPWSLRPGRGLIAVPDALVWWCLLPPLWRGTRMLKRRSGIGLTVAAVLPAGVVAAGLALLIANYGTVVRQRMQVVVLLVPVIALGLSLRRPRSPARSRHPAGVHNQAVIVRAFPEGPGAGDERQVRQAVGRGLRRR